MIDLLLKEMQNFGQIRLDGLSNKDYILKWLFNFLPSLKRNYIMAQASPALLTGIQVAEDSYTAALAADTAHQTTVTALTTATQAEATANAAALAAHQQATSDGLAVIVLVKAEFGLPA